MNFALILIGIALFILAVSYAKQVDAQSQLMRSEAALNEYALERGAVKIR